MNKPKEMAIVQLYGEVVSYIWLCTQKIFPFCEFGEGNFSNSSICSSVIYTVLCILSISAKEFSVTYLGWCRCMICVICILCISAQGILYDTYGC
jgi:hypothetical protein